MVNYKPSACGLDLEVSEKVELALCKTFNINFNIAFSSPQPSTICHDLRRGLVLNKILDQYNI